MIMKNPDKQKKRFVIYTRCSTDDQAQGDYTTLDAQAHHCKNMLDAFGYDLASLGKKGVVNDDGFSGKDLNRLGIQLILNELNKKRSFDGIIFFRLDRLTRNPRDLYALIDLFKAQDIDFISVRENLDSSTAIGRVVIGFLGLLSAFERELTGERVKASGIARVRQGLRIGGKVPIGYKLVKDGDPLPNGRQPNKVVIDEEIAPHLKIIWEMTAENKSLTEIGKELLKRGIKTANGKIWRRQGLSHIVKNPFYKGYVQYSGEVHKSTHEVLVEEKLWEKANAILTAKMPGHRFLKKRSEYGFLLASLIKCSTCGSHMVCSHSAGRGKRKFFYYECSRARQGLGCSRSRIPAITFDKAIIDYFKKASKDQEVIVKAIGDAFLDARIKLEKVEKQMQEKEEKLNKLRAETEKLLELALNATIEKGVTYKTKMAALETEITSLEEEIKKLEIQKQLSQMNAHSGEFLHTNIRLAMQHINKAPVEAQKNLLRALIKNIVIYDEYITIDMFIEQFSAEDLLTSAGVTDTNNTTKEKRPIPAKCRNKASVQSPTETQALNGTTGVGHKAGVSTVRPIWGG